MNMVHFGIIFFIVIQISVGIYVSKSIKNVDDYLVAGRRLGFFLVFISTFATWFGAESCISASGSAYRDGIGFGSTEPFAYGIALIVTGTFFSALLWSKKLTTLADVFRLRFSKKTEAMVALLMAPTSLLWASAQILAFGHIFSSSFGIDMQTSIFLSGFIVVIYTMAGGLLADVWTDAIQGVILILGLLIIFVALFQNNPADFTNVFSNLGTSFSATNDKSMFEIIEIWMIPICGSVIAQELISRICASRTKNIAVHSTQWAGGAYILVGLIPVFIGLAGRTLLPGLEESDQVLPTIAKNFLPPILYVVFVGALVCVILSTVDSAVMASAALISHNLVLNHFGKLSPKQNLVYTRLMVMTLGVVSCLLAYTGDSVYDLVEEASAFGSSGVFVAFVMGLFTNIGGQKSANASILMGVFFWIAGEHVFHWPTPYLVSLFASLVSYLGVALMDTKYHSVPQS
jgi:SSS family transporter